MLRDLQAAASRTGRRSSDVREARTEANADSPMGWPEGQPPAAELAIPPTEVDTCDDSQNLYGPAPTRQAEIQSRLGQVRDHLEAADRELVAIASEMIQATIPDGACRAGWAVCSHCLGSALDSATGTIWCPSCGRPGTRQGGSEAYFCSDRATVSFRDTSGAERSTCLSHAAAAFEHVSGLTLVQAEESDVQALLSVLHTPLRINMSGRESTAATPVPGQTQ